MYCSSRISHTLRRSAVRNFALVLSVTFIALAFAFSASDIQQPASAQSLSARWIGVNPPPFRLSGMTRLNNGKVFSVGITSTTGELPRRAAIYDPITDTWRETSALNYPRIGATLIPLFDGRQLVVGGIKDVPGVGPLPAGPPEIFDPATEKWTVITAPDHSSEINVNAWTRSNISYLPNGKVLVLSQILNSATLFDPATGAAKEVSSPHTRIGYSFPSSIVLRNGNVLFLNGENTSPSAEIFNPDTESWSTVDTPIFADVPLPGWLAATLPDGKVMGLFTFPSGQRLSALFDPRTMGWGDLTIRNTDLPMTLSLPTGEILAFQNNLAEIYLNDLKTWRTVNAPAQSGARGMLLANGQVYTGTELYTVDFGSSSPQTVVTTSSASFRVDALARGSLATAFGSNFSNSSELNSVSIQIKGSDGNLYTNNRLLAVTPNQINFLIPDFIPLGQAELTITNKNGGQSQRGLISIVGASPGIFTANVSGGGVPAAVAIRVKADGSQSYEPVASFDSAAGNFAAVPIDLGATDESVYLALFGTGIRGRRSLENVLVYIGGVRTQALYAEGQGSFDGLDQINVRIPRSLAGRGDVEILVTVDGKTANPVTVKIK
jgi:uncharacterized protein (TIGR03437 family)